MDLRVILNGKGPGVLKGAYAELPRYFKDTNKVEDVESRLVTCMVTLQGFGAEEIKKNRADGRSRRLDTPTRGRRFPLQSSLLIEEHSAKAHGLRPTH